MTPEVAEALASGYSLIHLATLFLSAGAAISAAFLAIPFTIDRLLPPPRQDRLADFLLFEAIRDGTYISMSDGRWCSVIEIRGAELILCPEDEHEDLFAKRKHLVDELQKHHLDQINVFQIKDRSPIHQEPRHRNPLLRAVAERWNTNFRHSYRITHYMMLIASGRPDAAQEKLQAAARFITETLSPYQCRLMREAPDFDAVRGPLAALARIASPITRPAPRSTNWTGRISDLLTADQVSFREEAKGVIRFAHGDDSKYAVIIGIRDCGEKTSESILKDVLAIDAELMIFHGIQPLENARQLLSLAREKKSAPFMSLSTSAAGEFESVIVMVEGSESGNKAALVNYALHVVVYGDCVAECEANAGLVNAILTRSGATPVRERKTAQALWFAQFQYDRMWPRMYRFLSSNVATNLFLQRVNEGMTRSDWIDEPITYFRSTYGSAYAFQFHATEDRQAPPHCLCIGPTGRGKTTFITFLAGQAMRIPNLRVFLFDRHEGARVFTTCAGGQYVTFDGDTQSANLNPLLLADTHENRRFLHRWLKLLTNASSPADEEEIARAITLVQQLLPNQRKLKNIHRAAFAPEGNVRSQLTRWIDEHAYGAYFNADEDTLDLSVNRLVGLDMTNILKEESTIAAPMMEYINHRIRMISKETGDPTLIFIDETQPMLQNRKFADDFVRTGLQEGRKIRQCYVLAFQTAEAIRTAGMSEVIRGQCQTAFFFRNPTAQAADYDDWRLTPSELAFVLGKEFAGYPFAVLIKKYASQQSAIVDISLSSLGHYFNAYQSGSPDVRLLSHMQSLHADAFLEPFLLAPR